MSNRPNDPLGLFTKLPPADQQRMEVDQQRREVERVELSQSTASKMDLATLVIGCLIGAAVLLIYQRFDNGRGSNDRDRGQQEQREQRDGGSDDKDQRSSLSYKTLIFLHERNPQSIEHDLLLREMPKFCETAKMEFRAFDDDTPDSPIPDLLSWAKSKGVEPPLIVVTDKDDRPAKAAKWPSGLDELKALLK